MTGWVVAAFADVPTEPGTWELDVGVDGIRTGLTVVVPEVARGPIVVALHYAGHGAPHFATDYVTTLVAPALEGLGALIVAPDCPGRSWAEPSSEKVVSALIGYAARTWGGDVRQVVLTGYSMGAVGGWWLADRSPTRFAVLVPVAGDPGDHAAHLTIPVYAIAGANDRIFPPPATERAIQALRKRGIAADLAVVTGPTHHDFGGYVSALRDAVPWIRDHL